MTRGGGSDGAEGAKRDREGPTHVKTEHPHPHDTPAEGSSLRIVPVVSDAEIGAVRELFREYAAWLELDLGFQGFEAELAGLPGAYVPPAGGLFLALGADGPLGCAAVRPFEPPAVAELKRLYVRPQSRGLGLGSALAEVAIEAARAGGYDLIRLDTLPAMGSARRLYESLGFYEIEPYRFNPVEDAKYLELDLRESGESGAAEATAAVDRYSQRGHA
jgi:ribosomal protein S18 acetylase RimI-like enzyme